MFNKRPLFYIPSSNIWKYENTKIPFVITDWDITEAAPQFTLIKEDDIDINVEDDILVVD